MSNAKTPLKFHLFLLLIVTLVLIWSLIKPLSYSSWAAESVPILIGLIILIATYRKFTFTTLSYTIMAILAILEFIGGHYTFEKVPLFNWIKEHSDLKRNDYDRFGHFMKGLFAIVFREILIRKVHLSKGAWLATISISILFSIAALYEIIEMLFYKIAKGTAIAKGFLGEQGDKFDSQWDMTSALIGAILAILFFSKWHNKLLERIHKS
ncbi:DUF2238 domain-containing protein [Rummeliibacillus sp. JY-2-4R]